MFLFVAPEYPSWIRRGREGGAAARSGDGSGGSPVPAAVPPWVGCGRRHGLFELPGSPAGSRTLLRAEPRPREWRLSLGTTARGKGKSFSSPFQDPSSHPGACPGEMWGVGWTMLSSRTWSIGFGRDLAGAGAARAAAIPEPAGSRSPGTSGHTGPAAAVCLFPDQERKVPRGASSAGREGLEINAGADQCY